MKHCKSSLILMSSFLFSCGQSSDDSALQFASKKIVNVCILNYYQNVPTKLLFSVEAQGSKKYKSDKEAFADLSELPSIINNMTTKCSQKSPSVNKSPAACTNLPTNSILSKHGNYFEKEFDGNVFIQAGCFTKKT